MDILIILMMVLGLTLVVAPSAVGVRYLVEWFSEKRRLKRRIREIY